MFSTCQPLNTSSTTAAIRQGTVLQAPFQTMGILFLAPFQTRQGLGFSFFSTVEDAAGTTVSYDEGGHQAATDAQTWASSLRTMLAENTTGRNTQYRGKGGGHHRHAHLFCVLHGSAGRRHAAAAQTVDVLNDDHRVIHLSILMLRERLARVITFRSSPVVNEHHCEQNGQRDADADHEGAGLISFRKMASTMMAEVAPHHHAGEDVVDDDGDVVALIASTTMCRPSYCFSSSLKCGSGSCRRPACTGSGILIDLRMDAFSLFRYMRCRRSYQ